jgi:hypothetical protein
VENREHARLDAERETGSAERPTHVVEGAEAGSSTPTSRRTSLRRCIPSSILPQRTDEERNAAMAGFIADLKVVAKLLAQI